MDSRPEANPGYLLPPNATRLAFTGLMLVTFLAALNQTVVATAAPHIASELGSPDRYSWLFTLYALASTVSVPLWGRLSDIHGRRPLLTAGIGFLLAGSAVGALAGSFDLVLVARTLQGIGAGCMVPTALAATADLVPASERGRWGGVYGGVLALAFVCGPLAGGWITDHAGWRWVFLVSLPFGALALATCWLTLRLPRPRDGGAVDWVGACLLTTVLTAFLLVTIRLGEGSGPLDPVVAASVLAGAAALRALIAQQRRSRDPFISPRLLANRSVRLGALALVGIGATMFSTLMFVPLFAQGVIGVSASRSGLLLMPLMLGLFATSVATGRRISRTGSYRAVIACGPPPIAAAFLLLAVGGAGVGTATMVLFSILVGLGLGCLWQNMVLVLQNAMGNRDLGMSTAASQLFRNIGGTVGVAFTGAVIAAGLGGSRVEPDLLTGQAADRLASAMTPAFLVMVPVMLLTLLLILRLPELPLDRAVEVADEIPDP